MKLTGPELIFAQRMLPHFMAGKSALEAARAVQEDDARLIAASFDRRTSHYFPTPDERGRSHVTAEGKGDVIASELSRRVYAALSATR
ncbi:hypothetical protein [Sphingobium abikonense]|uniref:hypothetical protein n=1 Tax=Sphingobium abikonense TaxID=86193 RepID=UPI0035186BAC